MLENLPQALKRHLEALLALETAIVETRERRVAQVDRIGRPNAPTSKTRCAGSPAPCTAR